MKRIWSPWRMKYLETNKDRQGCIFCDYLKENVDSVENLIISRGKYSFVIMNRYPYANGHLMVMPYDHVDSLNKLSLEIRSEMMELINRSTEVLQQVYHPDGFNIGANIGAAAGAGIAEHVHIHIVPRWNGDVNFMTAIGETRVLPEALGDSYKKIITFWNTY